MARIISATTSTYITTGILPYNNFTKFGYDSCEEIFNWLIWIISITSATVMYPIFIATTINFWWFTLIRHGMDKTFWWLTLISNATIKQPKNLQRSQRAANRKHFNTGFIISAYNYNLLILSGYMLHPCTVFQFSNAMELDTMLHISDCTDHVYKITAPPWKWLSLCYNRKPPKGFILEIMLFSAAIIATAISFATLCSHLRRRKKVVKPTSQNDAKQVYFNVTTAFQSKASVEDFVKRHMFNILAIIFVIDNAANVHIGNDKNMFKTLNPCTHRCVATIGGTDLEPEGIGTVIIQVQDNEGVFSEMTLEDVLYFPSSPVNLISIACLADQYKDDEGTCIRTAR